MFLQIFTDMFKWQESPRSVSKSKSREVDSRSIKQILQAIRDRDADLAEQLAKEHIVHVMQNLKNRI